MAYDPIRKRSVMFGGIDDAFALKNDVWEWDGSTWAQVLAIGPDAREGHAMFYNPDRGQVSVYGNSNGGGEDLWEWSGAAWTQRTLDTVNPQAYRRQVAYDAAQHALLVFGGRDSTFAPTAATRLLQYRPWTTVESCTSAQLDYDNDGKAGCADEECWSVCTPLCPPGTTCPAGAPKCGDGVCGAAEDCNICPGDCGACAAGVCGDYHCDAGETHASCPLDC